MYGYDGYGMTGWMLVWGVALVVGGLALIGGLVWVVATTAHRRAAPGPTVPAGTGSAAARQILDERYARGELATEEYRERVHTLGG